MFEPIINILELFSKFVHLPICFFFLIIPDGRQLKVGKSDELGILRKVLDISKIGQMRHFGAQNQHCRA